MSDAAVAIVDAPRRLDAIDRKILTVLQDDASLSVAEIGDRVGWGCRCRHRYLRWITAVKENCAHQRKMSKENPGLNFHFIHVPHLFARVQLVP